MTKISEFFVAFMISFVVRMSFAKCCILDENDQKICAGC